MARYKTASGKDYIWDEKSLSRLTVADLVEIAKSRRSTKFGFKKFLADYLLKVGERT